jgi:hypothetical protein
MVTSRPYGRVVICITKICKDQITECKMLTTKIAKIHSKKFLKGKVNRCIIYPEAAISQHDIFSSSSLLCFGVKS